MFPKQKHMGKRSKKTDSRKKTMAKLDRLFSEYIRRRDADKQGVCWCVTCNRPFHWKQIDCGHFVQRDRIATRFDERNAASQCPSCNRFRGGEQYKFGLAIDRRYGPGTAEMLQNLGKARGAKITTLWLQTVIDKYKELIKCLP